jgi:ABC-type phosphate transport system auxiliary subunit
MSDNIPLDIEDVTYTNQEFVDRLLLKKSEIDNMFSEQSKELDDINRKKEELNKREENVQYELSGLHGARVVLDQLINENSVKTEQEPEEV